jgi:hypothetical protein
MPVVHRRFVERRDVLALEVLDDGDLEAVSSSMSSISAGIESSPASFDARQRRSPANQLVATAVERSDEDRLEDAVLLHRRRQLLQALLVEGEARLFGFGSILSSGMMRTPTLRVVRLRREQADDGGESSRSSDRRRAAAARKSVLAKVDHLPGEVAIGLCRDAGSRVRR